MLKRILSLLTAAVMLLSLASCGGGDPTEQPTAAPTAAPTSAQASSDEPSDGFRMTRFIKEFSHEGVIDEQVLYDVDGVTVTALSIRYDPIAGAVINLGCKNSTENSVMFRADNSAVNGYMMPVDFSLSVGAGKSAEGEMTVSYTALAMAGLDRIATVEFSLVLVDPSSYAVADVCEPVRIVTTAAEGYEPPVPATVQTVYDKDGVKIMLMGLDDSLQFADSYVLMVYMCNDSDKDVSIQTGDVKVNGYDMTSAMTTTVLPGRRAVDIVTFFEQDMQEYGIEEIYSAELSFKVIDEESWDVIADTGLISADLTPAEI